jgi:hypothetical protein
MSSMTDQPTAVRRLNTQDAKALGDLVSILDDLQTVLRCCERLVNELADPSGEPDDLVLESFWTTAVLSYTRCFVNGSKKKGLTEQDVTQTSLQGEVLEWHKVLQRVRKHYAHAQDNPRELFSVGAAQDSEGRVSGIAITSTTQPPLDDLTVRQTGALAYELSQLVDKRITEHEERVRAAANALSKADLEKLPVIDLTDTPDSAPDA